jgi:LEA14-like dessication related protein
LIGAGNAILNAADFRKEKIVRTRFTVSVLALLFVCACGGGREQSPRVDVSITDLRLAQAGVLEQTYAMTLRVQNPHNFEIVADGLSFSVETNGKLFARGVSNESVVIPRLGEAMVRVQAVSDTSKAVEQVMDFQNIGFDGFRYRLVGRFFSGDQKFPFDYRGKIAIGR